MKKQRALSWLPAILMTAVLFALCFLFLDVHYAVNDDAGIQRAFIGYETGTPARFHLFIHGLLALPLAWLGSAAPTVAWFSWLQIALLFLACVVLAKSLMQCCLKAQKPLWQGVVLAAAALAALGVRPVARITFTQTAALLGAAAVAQLLSVDHAHATDKQVILGMVGALALVVAAYALRQVAALPILAFCGLAVGYIALTDYGFGAKARRSLKPLIVSVCLAAVVMGGLVGWRALECRQDGVREYLAWQQANTPVIDYIGVNNLTEDQLSAVGWTPVTRDLLNDWCFLDRRLTTDSFRRVANLAQTHTPALSQRLQSAQHTVAFTVQENRATLLCVAVAGLALILCVWAALAARRWLPALAALLAALGAAAMLLYLALSGRLPVHAMLMALLPSAAFILCLLPACMPGRGASAACVTLCALWTVVALCSAVPALLPNQEEELSNPLQELEECALLDPESLYLYDYTLVSADLRLFPDYSNGVPHNIAFWGGWGMRSPESVAQFAAFDIDLVNFDPETFLRDDVYLASGRVDPPPTLILNWLRQEVDPYADVMLAAEYSTLYLFQFY